MRKAQSILQLSHFLILIFYLLMGNLTYFAFGKLTQYYSFKNLNMQKNLMLWSQILYVLATFKNRKDQMDPICEILFQVFGLKGSEIEFRNKRYDVDNHDIQWALHEKQLSLLFPFLGNQRFERWWGKLVLL